MKKSHKKTDLHKFRQQNAIQPSIFIFDGLLFESYYTVLHIMWLMIKLINVQGSRGGPGTLT